MEKYDSMAKKGKGEDAMNLPGRQGMSHIHGVRPRVGI